MQSKPKIYVYGFTCSTPLFLQFSISSYLDTSLHLLFKIYCPFSIKVPVFDSYHPFFIPPTHFLSCQFFYSFSTTMSPSWVSNSYYGLSSVINGCYQQLAPFFERYHSFSIQGHQENMKMLNFCLILLNLLIFLDFELSGLSKIKQKLSIFMFS